MRLRENEIHEAGAGQLCSGDSLTPTLSEARLFASNDKLKSCLRLPRSKPPSQQMWSCHNYQFPPLLNDP
jgi:hypothetical protein